MKSDPIAEAKARHIKIPTKRTLSRYGLTEEIWCAILRSQDWKCPICGKESVWWNIDHHHVPGWEKMPLDRDWETISLQSIHTKTESA